MYEYVRCMTEATASRRREKSAVSSKEEMGGGRGGLLSCNVPFYVLFPECQ